MAKKKKHLGYVPFTPPPGSYDPGLDAAERAGGRGLGDLLAQIGDPSSGGLGGTQGHRALQDTYGDLGTIPDIQRQQRYGTEDLSTALQRGNRDYQTQHDQLGQDYAQNTQQLQHNYLNLGAKQTQGAAAAGVAGGGALSQALAKRGAHQGQEQGQLDQGFNRANTALDTAHNDFLANNAQGVTRLGEGAGIDLGRQNLAFGRGAEDRLTAGKIAQREQGAFGADTQTSRLGQVRQTAPDYYSQWVQQNHQRGFALSGARLKKPGRFR